MAVVKSAEDSVCYACNTKLADEALKCKTCQRLVHFECSDLPDYHLVRLFLQRQSTYTCRECITADAKYMEMLSKVKTTKEQEVTIIKAVAIDGEVETDNNDDLNNSPSQTELGTSTQQAERGAQEDTSVSQQQPGVIADAGLALTQQLPGNSGAANNCNNGNAGATDRSVVKNKVCRYYKTRTCKYGAYGNGCPFNHPKKCQKYIKHGNKAGGCKKGAKCGDYHPQLCWSSDNFGTCDREQCKYQHLQGTNRTPREALPSTANERRSEHQPQRRQGASARPAYAEVVAGGAPRHRPAEEDVQQRDFMKVMLDMMRRLMEQDRRSPSPQKSCLRCHEGS